MIDFEQLWIDGVNKKFEEMSSEIILNDNPKNARHLLQKLFQVGYAEKQQDADEDVTFYLASTRLCHLENRSSEHDVYDYQPLVEDAETFIKAGGSVQVVCRHAPVPSAFLTMLEKYTSTGRVEVRVCSEADQANSSWVDFSVCKDSFRVEIPDDELPKKERGLSAKAVACAKGDASVLEKLRDLFTRQWDASRPLTA